MVLANGDPPCRGSRELCEVASGDAAPPTLAPTEDYLIIIILLLFILIQFDLTTWTAEGCAEFCFWTARLALGVIYLISAYPRTISSSGGDIYSGCSVFCSTSLAGAWRSLSRLSYVSPELLRHVVPLLSCAPLAQEVHFLLTNFTATRLISIGRFARFWQIGRVTRLIAAGNNVLIGR